MSEQRFPLWTMALCLALAGSSGAEDATITWQERYYNPTPASDDFTLPLPCGGAMAFRKVEVPGGEGWIDDRAIELGQYDEKSGYKEGRRRSHIAGAFIDPAHPSHRYYYLGKYETTRDQYATLDGPCPEPSMEGRLPRVDVSWFEAVDFSRRYTEWLLRHARERLPVEAEEAGFVRLPTEAEWEFAARGGISVDSTEFLASTFPMQGDLKRYAWYQSTQSAQRLKPVGLLQPNPLDLYDILGNASEMVLVPFQLDRRGRLHGQAGGFIAKGGDYLTAAPRMRTAARDEHNYFDRRKNEAKRAGRLGFRLAITAPVITSLERARQLREEWLRLPDLRGNVGQQTNEALQALRTVTEKTTGDEALRTELEDLQRDLEVALTQINESRDRAVKALIRMGAFIGAKIAGNQTQINFIEHGIAFAQQELAKLRLKTQGRPNQAAVLGNMEGKVTRMENNLSTVRESLESSLSYYGDMVIDTANDYAMETIKAQLGILRREFMARKIDRLLPFAAIFAAHVETYKITQEADKQQWLDGILQHGERSNEQ